MLHSSLPLSLAQLLILSINEIDKYTLKSKRDILLLLVKELTPFIQLIKVVLYGTIFGYFSKVVEFFIRINHLCDRTSSMFKLIILFSSVYFAQGERAEIEGERSLAHFLNSFSYWSRKRIFFKKKNKNSLKAIEFLLSPSLPSRNSIFMLSFSTKQREGQPSKRREQLSFEAR